MLDVHYHINPNPAQLREENYIGSVNRYTINAIVLTFYTLSSFPFN